jgi:Fe-S cluster assembly protein SufD
VSRPALDLDVAGRAVVTESGIEIVSAPDGITFEPLPADYPSQLIPDDDKFAMENLAQWQHGLLVRVPKGVELDRPLYVQVTSNGGSLYWRMVVEAEEGARFTLIEDLSSAGEDTLAYTNAVVELFVHPRAKLEYVSLQNLSRETWHFGRHKAWLERDSELDWVIGGFGSKRGKVWIENDLAGPGATSRVTGAYFADGDQHLDYDTFQEHIAPNTESDFAFKGALRENASAVWRGMIRVEADAQKTNAYQENRNLLLSDQAHADSIPGLEIMANDVRCTHGATLGRVNREELFYLMARGLSRAEAERLIVRGFFQDVLDRIELAPVREALGAALEARIPQ